jgi:hypothetical protein
MPIPPLVFAGRILEKNPPCAPAAGSDDRGPQCAANNLADSDPHYATVDHTNGSSELVAVYGADRSTHGAGCDVQALAEPHRVWPDTITQHQANHHSHARAVTTANDLPDHQADTGAH